MLLGVVLCGGQSQRMGSDKGLLPVASRTWAQFTADKFIKLSLPVYISINATQLPSYRNIFPSDKLIMDTVDINGPLKGLLSVHRTFPNEDLLVIACDMIDMDLHTLQNLILTYRKYPSYDYYVHVLDNFIQPFPAIYPFQTLHDVQKKANNNQLESYSITRLINSSNCKRINIHTLTSFSNYNTISK